MSDEQIHDISDLKLTVQTLTDRVERLERAVTEMSVDALRAEPPRAAAPHAAPAPVAPAPVRVSPAPPVPAPPVRPPKPPKPPFDWGKLAAQLFAARTLAWAGGVATALGIVLLFVLAASRGWITPTMRVGIGTAVSLALLGAAIELDRRSWRSDAILAAAGAAIGGLYASLWAATSLYHLVASGAAAPLAALIAALAVATALRIHQEPLAVFGVSAAMLAPAAVSEDVTTGGVLFGAVMLAAALVLLVRTGWRLLAASAWAIGFIEAAVLLALSADHVGFGGPVVAAAVIAGLIVCLTYLLELLPAERGRLLELLPAERGRLTALGSLTAGSAFTISLGAAALYGGSRELDGHSLTGVALAGLTVVWLALAAVPVAVRRPHADLADLLAAFGLTSAAIATGLLAGGPALVCAWTAESVMLVVLAERIRRRSATRSLRTILAAAAYLALGIAAAADVLVPADRALPHVGAGSTGGSVALAAIALAGIVLCFGLRTYARPELASVWFVPAAALTFLPLWSLGAEAAVVAYAAMAAAVLIYRRTPLLVSWLPEWVALLAASAWWLAGAAVALVLTAPARDLAEGWSRLGEQHGLAGIAALFGAACILAWSLRRPERELFEHGLLVPVAALLYLVAEVLDAPYAIWAWLVIAGLLAAAVHVGPIRRRLTALALLVAGGSVLAVGVVSAWSRDMSLQAVVDHGRTAGWESIAFAVAAALLVALAFPERIGRAHALWLPVLLAAQLSTMLLPGQYPLVAVAALAVLAGVAVIARPRFIAGRLDREALAAICTVTTAVVAGVVLLAYETPRMLFETSHAPAAGLAAAAAAAAALLVAAAATRGLHWSAGPIRAAALLVCAGAAFCLWTLAAAILGAEQLVADAGVAASVHDHFQQGHVLVSIGWVMVGLALVVASLRGDHRGLRAAGIALLFVTLGKIFLYDLAYLTAMARAVSFIVTGSVLLLAALLLQRFAPHVKGAFHDEPPHAVA
jgi:uncharacterized membrane protein